MSALSEPLPPEGFRYVGQIVAQRTGLSQQDAQKRINDVYAKAQAKVRDAELAARQTADQARKASAYGALWLFNRCSSPRLLPASLPFSVVAAAMFEFVAPSLHEGVAMRSLLLLFLGIPIPITILIALFVH